MENKNKVEKAIELSKKLKEHDFEDNFSETNEDINETAENINSEYSVYLEIPNNNVSEVVLNDNIKKLNKEQLEIFSDIIARIDYQEKNIGKYESQINIFCSGVAGKSYSY